MKLEELTILHLSDLHFGGNASELVYIDLLSDIEAILQNVKQLIILVSGDFVFRGVYKANATKARSFFKKLKKCLDRIGIRDVIIEVTAGNHDVVRPRANNKYNNGKQLPDRTFFDKLAQDIYAIFKTKNKPRVGITAINHHKKRIFLIRVDSSFQLSKEEIEKEVRKDFSNGKLSEDENEKIKDLVATQLAKIDEDILAQQNVLQRDYEKKVEKLHNKRPALAIAVSHYPLTWLNKTGREQVQETLFKQGLSFVDIWISGHVHDVKSSYACENGKATVMLTTGIGRQDVSTTAQRYSVYRLCLDRNTSLVRVRRALFGRKFEDDPTFASPGSHNFHRLHILPLWSGHVGSIIRLNSPESRPAAAFYIDDSAVALIKEINDRLQLLRARIAIRNKEFAGQFKNALCKMHVDPNDIAEWAAGIRKPQAIPSVITVINNEIRSENSFIKFLKYICLEVVQALKRNWKSLNLFLPYCDESNTLQHIVWRAHFRYYLGHNGAKDPEFCDVYKAFCSDNLADRPSKIKNVRWGGVIKGAFEHPARMMINSANYGLNQTKTKWDDFITIAPRLPGNDISIDGGINTAQGKRPLLTFGLSVKGDNFENSALASKCLYVLEYLNLESIISAGIMDFITLTGFDYVQFLRRKANAKSKARKRR